MTPEEQAAEAQILYNHIVDYWYEVDHNGGQGSSVCYTEDGVFRGGRKPLVGRAAIEHFYSWRLSKSARTSRHIVTNFRARFQDAANATTNCIMILHAADGVPPLPSSVPLGIFDQNDRWVKQDGRWLVADRHFVAIFRDEEANARSAMGQADDSPFKE